jgi:hypothetical protein
VDAQDAKRKLGLLIDERKQQQQQTEQLQSEVTGLRADNIALQHRLETQCALAADHAAKMAQREAALGKFQQEIAGLTAQVRAAAAHQDTATTARTEFLQKIEIQASTIYDLHHAVDAVGCSFLGFL